MGSNKVLAIFVNTNKGALVRLFDYSQLKTKLTEETSRGSSLSWIQASLTCLLTAQGVKENKA